MFIKHRNQTHTKTHTPNAKYLQTCSDDIPQHIHHLLSSHRKQVPNAYIHCTAHRPTRTHNPMCSTSYYPSLVSQTSQPPIHQRFPVFSFCTQTKLTVFVCVCAVLQGFMNDGTCMCVCAVLQGFMNDGTCMCVCSFARIHE